MPKHSLTVTSEGAVVTQDIDVTLYYNDDQWKEFQDAVQEGINRGAFTLTLEDDTWKLKPNLLYVQTVGMFSIPKEYKITEGQTLDSVCNTLSSCGTLSQADKNNAVNMGEYLGVTEGKPVQPSKRRDIEELKKEYLSSIKHENPNIAGTVASSENTGSKTISFSLPEFVTLGLKGQRASNIAKIGEYGNFELSISETDPNFGATVMFVENMLKFIENSSTYKIEREFEDSDIIAIVEVDPEKYKKSSASATALNDDRRKSLYVAKAVERSQSTDSTGSSPRNKILVGDNKLDQVLAEIHSKLTRERVTGLPAMPGKKPQNNNSLRAALSACFGGMFAKSKEQKLKDLAENSLAVTTIKDLANEGNKDNGPRVEVITKEQTGQKNTR